MSEVQVVSGEVVTSLAQNEQVIEKGLTSFVEVGRALALIRDERQYIEAGFDTFEDYCRERWDLSRSYASGQIDAARVVDVVSSREDIEPPQTEFHARPLVKLLNQDGEQAVVNAWKQVIAKHKGEGPISGREVSRFLTLGASYSKPGWNERIGEAADHLIKAEKQLRIVEDEITAKNRTEVSEPMRKKAARYRDMAQDVSERFDAIAQS